MEEEKKDFTVKDRRAFSEEGRPTREKSEAEKPETAAAEKEKKDQRKADAQPQASGDTKTSPLPEVNFATFIFSLNSSALLHLGVIGDPTTGKRAKNLPLAKQTIDILGMLEEKTRGNLTDEESAMLTNILYDLRIIYVRETS